MPYHTVPYHSTPCLAPCEAESAWNFFIGGYQPAQKWLKDRKGMTLSFEDVKHYQRIIGYYWLDTWIMANVIQLASA